MAAQGDSFSLRIIEVGVDKAYSYVFLLLRNCFIYKLIKTTVCLSRGSVGGLEIQNADSIRLYHR
jgi:hypothetical protein